ncbi:Rid family detoxifying hydrolase [Blochmannia endosymbiont of Camponotus (Colobopsis) obliquus]|uniref:Rid family detoxifying hydrolase n=1 Tax=Blochmannia endosymbiont of Camponotus (Colobopsis) obliquus TaxID=1505597 RepID=UPI00061A62E6|nr:Rid family detoxifying hydrolase [Blochmannia endosymbiont of Camponotus (Colobopsis) obliquus]AKC60215.1 Putative reactive intermediate deaminase TdcF [Blochmannia endosymbiont of Camponotus (Colobopsis) obliquus]
MIKIINIIKNVKTTGPYSPAIDTGFLIFISGQIGSISHNNNIDDSIQHQTKQSLKKIKNILKTTNLGISNIVKTTLFITDMNDLNIINEIYESFFNTHNASFPARSCIEVSRLPQNAKIEIDAIAIRT